MGNQTKSSYVYPIGHSQFKMTKSRTTKISTIIGSVLLLFMALFHGSGINYVNSIIEQSNSEPIVKDIFPVLYVHPSIQLLGLFGLGILTLFMKAESEKILFFISIFVLIDSCLAFYLGATLPGILLIFSSFLFALGGIKRK